ncbi:MAG: hypothetical protein EYC70_01790 [Planctomycetota bacterium]|nr:MAG: hypothetical protein EYC70_01790 [Planctomycetota bacterium]
MQFWNVAPLGASLLVSLGAPAPLHIPHDAANGVAVARLAGGGHEIVIVSGGLYRALRSVDDGLSWEVVVGAGLEIPGAADVVYHAGLNPQRFLIGSADGVFAYDPATRQVAAASAGLPAGDRDIVDMDAPAAGSDGPVLLVTSKGSVYAWDESAGGWGLSLATGLSTRSATVAVVPHYSAAAPPGPARSMAAAVNGALYMSQDGGGTWAVSSQFPTPATGLQDWIILAMAFSDDYDSSGAIVVGRTRQDPLYGGFFGEGELWRSGDFGATFQRMLAVDASIEAIAATPPDAAGTRYFLASGGYYGSRAIGYLRSGDGGVSWSDHGSAQDMSLEHGAGPYGTDVHGWLKHKQAFAVSPDFSSDGMLLSARLEGLWQSRDAGLHWLQKAVRSDRETRDAAAAFDLHGTLAGFGSGYGSAVVASSMDGSQDLVLGPGAPTAYLKELEISPAFAQDGMLVVSGEDGLRLWFDPRLPANNPYARTGWVIPPLAEIGTGEHFRGYARTLAISPHFDARNGAADQTFYWCAWERPPMRTEDGGLTYTALRRRTGGGNISFVDQMAIAPSYDAATAAGRTDVYASLELSGDLYRLDDAQWTFVARFGSIIMGIVPDPAFSRPGNPRLFVALRLAPYVVMVEDHPGGATVTPLRFNMPSTTLMQSLAAHVDAGPQRLLYAATWGAGVLRCDLSAGTPAWEPVGTGYPSWFVQKMTLSPDFANDRVLLLATQYGLLRGEDRPGGAWTPLTNESWRDNVAPDFTTFAPKDPANPQPDRPWHWDEVRAADYAGQLRFLSVDAGVALWDGSYLVGTGYARRLILHTASGPGMGSVRFAAFDYRTGALLDQADVNLATHSATLDEAEVQLRWPRLAPALLRIDTKLDPGETFLFDGVSFIR